MTRAGRTLWIDGTAGASGDMILGGLLDVGVPLARIRRAIEALPLSGWRITARRVRRAGLAARKVDVHVASGGPDRRWRDIRRILESGRLEPAVRNAALVVFRRLIEAEAEAHGKKPDDVHLHEAGALDAIVDVVGACAGFRHLAPDRIVVSPLTTGSGRVDCRHGSYPVPGPATALLVRGVPVTSAGLAGERLTPTGAAILTSVADAWGHLPAMKPLAVGHGAGDREFRDRPNVLRMVLGEADASEPAPRRDAVIVLEATIDDATPQVLAWAAERLLRAGAREVYTTPVVMKKGRPGHLMTVLGRPRDLDALAAVLFAETTTLGLRFRREERIELERAVLGVRTPHGVVRVKVGTLGGVEVQAWPEYEDCAALSRLRGVPLKRVQQDALAAHREGAREAGARPARKGKGR